MMTLRNLRYHRPVFPLSILSKIFENEVDSRLVTFLVMHKIIYEKQIGIRKKPCRYMEYIFFQ